MFVKHLVTTIFVLLVVPTLTGCAIPYHETQTPGAKGTVVDARTGAPISGAVVTLLGYGYGSPPENDVFDLRTAADGRFEIPPKQRWIIYIVPSDPPPRWAKVKVRANGYVDVEREIYKSMTDLRIIPMTRTDQ